MNAPVRREWTLLASVEAGPWCAIDRADGCAAEDWYQSAYDHPDGTALRVVSPDGTTHSLCVVVAGGACEVALSATTRGYLGANACAAWDADPVAWWRTSSDGRYLLRVAGEAASRAGHGSPLHRAVVRAACDCARLALPTWEARYPDDARPRTAIETAERWVRGEATLDDVRAASAAAYAAACAAAYAAAYASAATAYAAACAASAASAAAYAATCTAYARASTLAQCADLARGRVALPEVLTALVGGVR
mgnify:CR=1 FL=1